MVKFCFSFRLIIQDLNKQYLRTYINELTKGSFFYLFTLLSPSTRLMASTHTHTLTVIKKEINIRIRIKNYFKSDQRERRFSFFKSYHLFQFPTAMNECLDVAVALAVEIDPWT